MSSPPLATALAKDKPLFPRRVYRNFEGAVKVALVPNSLVSYLDKNVYDAFAFKNESIDDYKKFYLNKLKFVLNEINDVNFIVFGEYSFPYCSNENRNNEFKDKLARLSEEYSVYIVAGSYQDYLDTNFSVSLIFSPWRKEPFEINKWIQATNAKETISTPDEIECKFIYSEFGYFTSLTCIDIADENFIRKIGEFNNNDDKKKTLDLLLNPSYDESGKIIEKSRVCSYKTLLTCVHVNELNSGKSKVFLMADEITDFETYYFNEEPIFIYNLCMGDLHERRRIKGVGKKTESLDDDV